MKKTLALIGLIVFLFAGIARAELAGTLKIPPNPIDWGNTATGEGALWSVTTGDYNTADGYQALVSNTTGSENTATGFMALQFNTTGAANTASGMGALQNNISGHDNNATGFGALQFNTTGYWNTADGRRALYENTAGYSNTAIGMGALYDAKGNSNTALGFNAGFNGGAGWTGSNNIYIGTYAIGSSTESNTIRIGSFDLNRVLLTKQTFIAGIYGATASGGTEVFVTSNGKLGTVNSSHRYKEEIADMGDASSGLMKLRPVTFRYKPEYAGGPRTLQYGLIAEEVAEVYPDLVQYDPKTGQPQTVSYHLINAMLLNEVQKQERRIAALQEQNKELSALKEQVSELSAQLRDLSAQVAQNAASSAHFSKLDDHLNR